MFNSDTESSLFKKLYFILRTNFHYHFSFKKKFAHIKKRPEIWGIWNVVIYGPNISIGENVVIIGANSFNTHISTVKIGKYEGSVKIGDNVLIMNGVRISSATEIVIGDDCMLANFSYLMDSDWHDIYSRGRAVGKTSPVILDDNVWIGDSAIVCKGVRIGKNSIVGAGAVVTRDVPPNVIVAGNPAVIVKELNPDDIVTRTEFRRLEMNNMKKETV